MWLLRVSADSSRRRMHVEGKRLDNNDGGHICSRNLASPDPFRWHRLAIDRKSALFEPHRNASVRPNSRKRNAVTETIGATRRLSQDLERADNGRM